MKAIFLTLCLALTLPALALLSPLSQSAVEIRSLLEDPEFMESLPQSGPIERIIKTEHGYRITTSHYALRVDVTPNPQSRPGPQRFHFIFHPPTKLP